MTIWAIQRPEEEEHINFVYQSLKKGISRFGWSYAKNSDLKQLDDMAWDEMSSEQVDCYKKARFLLDVQPGDWVVHISIPDKGECITGKVVESYKFDSNPNEVNDFRHTLLLDRQSIVEFDRNDANVLPIVSSRLKLMRNHWRIHYPTEFEQSLTNIRGNLVTLKPDERANTHHLQNDLSPLLRVVTGKIHAHNPSSHFEAFLAEVFRKMPGVTNVREHGRLKGFGTDNGADLIISYQTGLPIAKLQKPATLVVQAKSYNDQHWETYGVDQLRDAMNTFKADSGLLISTAEVSPPLLKAIEQLNEEMLEQGKTVALLSGAEVARFALRFAPNLLFGEE